MSEFPYKEELNNIKVFAPLSKKQEVYLNDDVNDIVVWGGAAASGKSYVSALDNLISGWSDPDFRSVIVRRTKEQLKGAGSLYDECVQMYSQFGIKPKGNAMEFCFPSGSVMKMAYSDKPADKDNFQGQQVTRYLVDEGQQLLHGNVTYLLSRLRSKSKKKHQLKITCNPLYDSYLRIWLEQGGYIDEHGFPNPEMDGVTTYYAETAGEVVFCKTMEDFVERFRDPETDEMMADPLKFVFYSANCYDNPWIVKHKPSYIRNLKNLPSVDMERLLLGNWYARERASGYFKREWVQMVDLADVPMDARRVRCWDKAATLPSTANPNPDWTVGIKGCLDDLGNLYVIDVVRFRDRAAKVQQAIENIALADGKPCLVGIPQDVGGAGKEAAEYTRALLIKRGINVIVNKTRKSKLERFEPVAIAAQNRQIYVVRGDWNKDFFDELESFTGDNKNHDDQVDALSDVFLVLTQKNMIPNIKVNPKRQNTSGTLL